MTLKNTLTDANTARRVAIGSVFALTLLSFMLFSGMASAYHAQNPSIPDSIEHDILDFCPASDTAEGQTLGVLYFTSDTINSSGGSGSTGVNASAVMCTNDNYTQVRDIDIFPARITRTAGSGDVSLPPHFHPPNIPVNHFERFSGPVGGTATFSNLSSGWNCWEVEYDMIARYGSGTSNLPGFGSRDLCVYYNPPINPYRVQGYRTYGSGSGTAFPNGTGYTRIAGTNYISNPYIVSRNNTSTTVTAQTPITYNGRTYDRVGYTLCVDNTGCHGGARNGNGSVNLSNKNGGYYDLWWHYQVRDGSPELSLSADCPDKRMRISASDPDGSPVPVQYRIRPRGGSWSGYTTVNVSGSYHIDMSGYNQYEIFEVQAETGGVVPSGSSASSPITRNENYGRGGNRACAAREFTIDPLPRSPILNPDEENPVSVDFGSSAHATISPTPSGQPTHVNGVSLDRDFFVRRGATTFAINPAPASDPRNVNVPRSSDLPDITDARNLTSLGLRTGDLVCVSVTVSPARGEVDTAGDIIAGTGSGSDTEEDCTRVVSKPYFRVYNSDVSVGFINCPGWTNGLNSGRLIAWNKGAGEGSGTQLAAYAFDAIDGFSTATGRSISAPLPTIGLTFSNTSGGPDGYGVGFGAGFCAYDYFGNKGSATATTGDRTINGLNLSVGQKIVRYYEGNVHITDNITYDTGGWTDVLQIPNFTLVVKGNIYISPDVGQLDGFYVAQPDDSGDGGEIVTCATGYGLPSDGVIANECSDRKLTVYGAFTARLVRLLRTNGSLRNSSNTELRGSPTIAEEFIFSPEAWLSSPIERLNSPTEYESATSSAPIL